MKLYLAITSFTYLLTTFFQLFNTILKTNFIKFEIGFWFLKMLF